MRSADLGLGILEAELDMIEPGLDQCRQALAVSSTPEVMRLL